MSFYTKEEKMNSISIHRNNYQTSWITCDWYLCF